MSMNPQAEDFERLAIRWADAPHTTKDYPSMIAAITAFPELYAKSRDALPQNDGDRAFALVARAALTLDRYVTMAQSDEEAARLTAEASSLIDEALKLDPACYDAVRIGRYLDRPARDEMVVFLADEADEVREVCLATSRKNGIEPPPGKLSMSVYLRPYLRWLFDLANEQLGCGRYRLSLDTCLAALDADAADAAGLRHIAAYDYVKLEDAEGLAALMARFPHAAGDAWFLLSRCFMAYKQRRLDDATAILHQIVRAFPQAGCTLFYQDELPAGVFGHLEYAPGTEDELYIAVSEGAVVFDENCGDYASPLSDWIARDPMVEEARVAEEARMPAPGRAAASSPAADRARPAAGEADPDALGGFDDVTCVDDLLRALGSFDEPAPEPAPTPAEHAAPDGPGNPGDPGDAAPSDDDPVNPNAQGR